MKVNFNQPFKDPFGNPLIDKDGKTTMINKNLGLALFNLGGEKCPLPPDQKYMAFTLSVKLANASGEVEISEEEAQFIDLMASKIYMAGPYGNIKLLISKSK